MASMSASCPPKFFGVSYTGSTPALGAGRLGSIPSSPTKLDILAVLFGDKVEKFSIIIIRKLKNTADGDFVLIDRIL